MENKPSRFNIFCKGEKIFSEISEEEFFDTMEDLAQKFYESGSPEPHEITHEILED
jgi:hypothetical protein